MAYDGKYDLIGRRIPRTDAHIQVTGVCEYAEDIYRPGMLHAKAHFAKYAHARILSIDTSKAAAMPGVRAVITHEDIPNNRWGFLPHISDQRVLADDAVRYRGDAIAVVAADTIEQASEAADAIEVEYDPLPVISNIKDAIAPGAVLIHGDMFSSNIAFHCKAYLGDVERGFSESDLIVEKTYSTKKVEHAPIETHVAVAELESDGRLVITCTTTRPFNYAKSIASILKMSLNQFQIKSPQGLGGSFGAKNEVMLEPCVALLCLRTRRPVKLIFSREDEFAASTVRHSYSLTYKTGVTKDGYLKAQEITLYSDTGPYIGLGEPQLVKACVNACGPYNVPNIKTDAYLVFTNGLLGGAMRGMGVPQVCFGHESQMELVADELGMDPIEFRRRNLFGDRGQMPNGQLVYSAGARLAFERAWELFHENSGDKGVKS